MSAPLPAPDDAPRTRLSPTAFRMARVVVAMVLVLGVGGAVSVLLGGRFASLPVALVAAFFAFRVWRAPVRGAASDAR